MKPLKDILKRGEKIIDDPVEEKRLKAEGRLFRRVQGHAVLMNAASEKAVRDDQLARASVKAERDRIEAAQAAENEAVLDRVAGAAKVTTAELKAALGLT